MHPLMMDLLPLVRQGYCCSQLLVQLLVQAQGREVPDLVRALHGLCHGIGQSGGPCGLLTGGACVLALLAGARRPTAATPASRWRWGWERVRRRARSPIPWPVATCWPNAGKRFWS